MKCQAFFIWENNKLSSVYHLLNYVAQREVKVKQSFSEQPGLRSVFVDVQADQELSVWVMYFNFVSYLERFI